MIGWKTTPESTDRFYGFFQFIEDGSNDDEDIEYYVSYHDDIRYKSVHISEYLAAEAEDYNNLMNKIKYKHGE